jgi:hypothetical protein
VAAANFSDTVAAVQSLVQANPSLASLLDTLNLAQELARKGTNGSAQWDIDYEFGDHHTVTVNGQIMQ